MESHYFSRWFGNYKRSHGILDPRKVFHSFRHSFKDIGFDCDVQEAILDKLQGHTPKHAGGDYGARKNLITLNNAIQKISFPVSLSQYHVSTKHPLNPTSNLLKEEAPSSFVSNVGMNMPTYTPIPPHENEPLSTYITLADVYHRHGKALYGDSWQNYHVVDYSGERPVKADLSKFLRTERNLTTQPELKRIREEDLSSIKAQQPNADDRDEYDRFMGMLAKELKKMRVHTTTVRGNNIDCPAVELWGTDDYSLSTILSQVTRRIDGASWRLLFSPRDTKEFVKFISRTQGARKNSRGGRKPTIPWEFLDKQLIKMYSSPTPPPTYTRAGELIKTWIQKDPSLLSTGVTLQEATPSESAIKKKVLALRKEGRIPNRH